MPPPRWTGRHYDGRRRRTWHHTAPTRRPIDHDRSTDRRPAHNESIQSQMSAARHVPPCMPHSTGHRLQYLANDRRLPVTLPRPRRGLSLVCLGKGAGVLRRACLSVCLSASISPKLHVRSVLVILLQSVPQITALKLSGYYNTAW